MTHPITSGRVAGPLSRRARAAHTARRPKGSARMRTRRPKGSARMRATSARALRPTCRGNLSTMSCSCHRLPTTSPSHMTSNRHPSCRDPEKRDAKEACIENDAAHNHLYNTMIGEIMPHFRLARRKRKKRYLGTAIGQLLAFFPPFFAPTAPCKIKKSYLGTANGQL